MGWKFWRKKQASPESVQLDAIYKYLADMDKQSAEDAKRLAGLEENISSLSEQIQKWNRFQYKTAQDTGVRLDKLEQGIRFAGQLLEEKEQLSERLVTMEKQTNQVITSLIHWLDDMDHLSMKLSGDNTSQWLETIGQWSQQLCATLKVLDIHEMDVLNRSFDPRIAESVETVTFESVRSQPGFANPVPFQVVSVIRRGYIQGHHTILRKAQVITLQYEGGE